MQLLDAWTSRDLHTFCKLLKEPDVSADHLYDPPHFATCLYLTCNEEGGAQYASALLEAGADPNNLHRIRKEAPIHVAALCGRFEVLNVLLSNPQTDVNIKDDFGNTALHLIAKQRLRNVSDNPVNKRIQCMKLLMKRSGIDPNIVNKNGYTAVHLGAAFDCEMMVQTILKIAGNDLDIDARKINRKSARDTILQKYPEFAALLPEQKRDGNTKPTVYSSTQFRYLYLGDFN
jgi:ankyrin repeat protein